MQRLSDSAARLLSCSQVITTVWTVVKELVENSLDAGASSIEVRLAYMYNIGNSRDENYGLDRIEVRDNGRGFSPSQAVFIAQRHYTSKLSDFGDFEHLETYGFRGEALGSLCSLSDVCIMSRTDDQEMGMTYVFKSTGEMVASKPSPGERGTTVIVQRLFKSVPVRRQMYQNPKKQGVELSRVQDLLTAFGLIHPPVRLELRHNKSVVWRKNKVADCRSAFSVLFGSSAVSQMMTLELELPEIGMRVCGILPKRDADPSKVMTSNSSHCVIAVNSRPVEMKSALKVLHQTVKCQSNKSSKVHYPLGLLHLQFSPSAIDVNVEPNKTRVLIQNEEAVIASLRAKLEEFYERKSSDVAEEECTQIVDPTEKADECNIVMTPSSDRRGSDGANISSVNDMTTDTSDGVSDQTHDVFPDNSVSDNDLACLVLQSKGDDTNVCQRHTENKSCVPGSSKTGSDKESAVDWSMGRSITNNNGNGSPVEPVRILTGANVLSKQVSCKGVSSTRESPAKKLKIADPVGNGLLSSLRQATVRSVSASNGMCSKNLSKHTKAATVPSVYGLMQTAASRKATSQHKKSKQIKFSLSFLKQTMMSPERRMNVSMLSSPEPKVVGSLDENALWIIQRNHQLLCFDCVRAKETSLFEKLMDQHSIPHEPMEDVVTLDAGMLGGCEFWDRLMSMEWSTSSWDSSRLCEDLLVKANGLVIKQIVSQQGCETLLTEVASHLPHYGVSDLKQMLVAVVAYEAENGSLCPLAHSRPVKVETYLKNEASRLAKTSRHMIMKSEAFSLFRSASLSLRFCCSLVEFENESFNAASQTSSIFSGDLCQ